MASNYIQKTGSKRGYGSCQSCGQEYHNRKKPKVCDCGRELGGSFVCDSDNRNNLKLDDKKVLPVSVVVYNDDRGCLKSIKMNNNGDRKFLFATNSDLVCYNNDCRDLRSASVASKVSFECKHSKHPSVQPMYSVTEFQLCDITEFTPDLKKQSDIVEMQSLLNKSDFKYPAVAKVSCKSYAVKAFTSTTAEMNYVHVKVAAIKGTGKNQIRCMANDCRKKKGRTKTVSNFSLFFIGNSILCLAFFNFLKLRRFKFVGRYSIELLEPHCKSR